MHQQSLFEDTLSTRTPLQESWFQHILRQTGIQDVSGWPDDFGIAIHRWFQATGCEPIKILSLFSGGGGLDIGFHDAGFRSLQMIEIESKYVATLKKNAMPNRVFDGSYPIQIDIADFSTQAKVDFIIGGPPCQTFSAAGRRAAGVLGMDDPRGVLFTEYVRLLTELQPKGFLFENVYGITGAQNGEAWTAIKDAFRSAGYSIFYRILDSADYGVPQHRERLFIVGLRNGEFRFPLPTHGPDSPGNEPYFTAGKAVKGADVSGISEGLGGQFGHLLNDIPPGLNYSFYTEKMGHPKPVFAWRSKFSDYLYKADPDTPVRTIKAQGGQYTGPFSWENRPFSVAEFKRLQTFPDAYEIVGSRQIAIEQIGNSVPPQLARMLALSILHQVMGIEPPFPMRYLDSHIELGFRQRKRDLTDVYRQKASLALAQSKSENNGSGSTRSAKPSTTETVRYLGKNFAWEESRQSLGIGFLVRSTINDTEWTFVINPVVSKMNQQIHPTATLSIEPFNSHTKWPVPTRRITLQTSSQDVRAFTAFWKAFEEKLTEQVGLADLIQLFGYYQYKSTIRCVLNLDDSLKDNPDWQLLPLLVQGVGVAQQLSSHNFAGLFNIQPNEVLPNFQRLRLLGYEVRNTNTNAQIATGEYLIPYAFPTLNPRSLQLRKRLTK